MSNENGTGLTTQEQPQTQIQTVTKHDGFMGMMSVAFERGATIEEMRQLFEFKKDVEAEEARKAFVQAMADFKAHGIVVEKDKDNAQYGSKYVSLGNLVNTVTPFLSQHGLSADWDINQKEGITVTCTITHNMGHSKKVEMKVAPDTSGAKNPIQQVKSAITYAKACTFESACGLASSDANVDDDGKGAGKPSMDPNDVIAHIDNIRAARNDQELKKFFGAAYREAKEIGDTTAQADFIKAKDEQKKQIGETR